MQGSGTEVPQHYRGRHAEEVGEGWEGGGGKVGGYESHDDAPTGVNWMQQHLSDSLNSLEATAGVSFGGGQGGGPT